MATVSNAAKVMPLVLSLGVAFGALAQQAPPVVDTEKSDAVPTQRRLTDAQMSEANARLEGAKLLADRVGSDAKAARLGNGWREDLIRQLLFLKSSDLRALAGKPASTSYSQLTAAARDILSGNAARVQEKALGSSTQDLVFYPITPCRNVDTRNAGGQIAGGTFRDFDADQGAAQGGVAGCFVVPARDAAAWALNITVINMNTTGFVAVRSVGSSNVTSLVNYTGPGQQVNNFVIVNNSHTSASEYEVFAATPVDVIVDLYGYFVSPAATALDCVFTALGSVSVANGGNGTAMSPQCSTGYTVTGGSCESPSSYFARLSGSRIGTGSSWWCDYTNQSGGTISFTSQARCCRVPGF